MTPNHIPTQEETKSHSVLRSPKGARPLGQTMNLSAFETDFNQGLDTLKKENFGSRIWGKDPSLWKMDPDHQKIIRNSLGWLRIAEWMLPRIQEITDLAEEIRKDGVTDVVLLGMGGSSLAAEVFRLCLPARPGSPKLHVLDSTDPGWVSMIERSVKMEKTVFVVSSKSGSTIEPLSFYNYFFDRTNGNGAQFVAVTDPGSYLEGVAKEKKFRKIFINPSDIGGRFSALSYFGLVPAALAGIDVRKMAESAVRMMGACGADVPLEKNPGALLGCMMGALAKKGVDKVTVLTPKPLEPLGLWIEQLVAESSGKEGKGIVPIAAEAIGAPEKYGMDRVLVITSNGKDTAFESAIAPLEKKLPSVRITLEEPHDLGAEMFRWEIAISAACKLLGVDPYDQPNVQEAKDLAKSALKAIKEQGASQEPPAHFTGRKIALTFSKSVTEKTPSGFLRSIRTGDYIGILPFTPFDPVLHETLAQLRTALRDKTGAATLFGYGPRYLHSTGQLHKGGGNNGVFLVLTADPEKDMKVPEQSFTFGQLEKAQALGDFQALDAKGRRAVRVHLSSPLNEAVKELAEILR